MVRTRWIAGLLVASSLVACGKKPEPKEPDDEEQEPVKEPPKPAPETEADRAAKRLTAAHAIVPDGSACLPTALKEPGAPRIELGDVAGAAGICAIDQDPSRLLGPVACWKVDVQTNAITYVAPQPLPGIGFQVKTDDSKCARGFCAPVEIPAKAHIVYSPDGGKVAVAAGDSIHLFDAANKSHLLGFSIRGDKGVTGDVTALYWVGDSLFVSGSETGGVWVFKADGAPVGGIEVLGGKAGQLVSLKNGGSFSVLNKNQVAIAEQGWTTFTTYDVDSGKRTKAQRKLAKSPCKPEETSAYWSDPGAAPDGKCKDYMTKTFGYWAGANGILGSKNLVIVLRGARLGELGVVDPKTLIEQKKVIAMEWCKAGGGGDVAPPGE